MFAVSKSWTKVYLNNLFVFGADVAFCSVRFSLDVGFGTDF